MSDDSRFAPPLRPLCWRPAAGARLRSLAFSPRGGRLSVAADDGTVRAVEFRDRAAGFARRAHAGPAVAVVFASERLVVSAGEDGRVRVHDARTGEETFTSLAPAPGWPAGLVARAGAPIVASLEGRSIRLLDVERGHEVATLRGLRSTVALAAFPTERRLIAVTPGAVYGFDPRRPMNRPRILGTPGVDAGSLSALARGPLEVFSSRGDGVVRRRVALDGTPAAALRPLEGRVTALATCDHPRTIAAGTACGRVFLWHRTDHVPRLVAEGAPGGVSALAIGPRAGILAVGSESGAFALIRAPRERGRAWPWTWRSGPRQARAGERGEVVESERASPPEEDA